MDEHINMNDSIHVFLTWLHSKVRVALPTEKQKKMLAQQVIYNSRIDLLETTVLLHTNAKK